LHLVFLDDDGIAISAVQQGRGRLGQGIDVALDLIGLLQQERRGDPYAVADEGIDVAPRRAAGARRPCRRPRSSGS
jgi:hypothetical protein